jgi:hypothetical protein
MKLANCNASNDVSSLPPEPAGWTRWLPGLQMLRRYELAWLRHDLMAGLVLTTMLVPVGIAYAVASGVPGIYGLYATIVAAAGLCALRPQPHPGAGAGFLAGGAHPRRGAAAVGRRPDARHRSGRHDGRGVGPGVHRWRASRAWASSPNCCPSRSATAT